MDADADTLALIAALSLADISSVHAARKGEAPAGAPQTDEELAFELCAAEAAALLALSQDAILAESIDRALQTDRAALRACAAVEAQEASDRNAALALAGQAPQTSPSYRCGEGDGEVVSVADLLERLSVCSDDDDTSTSAQASSSRTTLPPQSTPRGPPKQCVICGDTIRGHEIRAPCGHHYDQTCLVALFRAATVDESLYPPRCCQQAFSLPDVRAYLGEGLARAFETKALEFGTANRVYCHLPTCSRFLGAATPAAHAYRCPACAAQTCGQCKEPAHAPRACDTAADRAILQLAAEAGWRRCPGCSHLVELAYGCYHMTCRCRRQFCYLCAADWKTCECAQWEEGRLRDAAAERVQRRQPADAPRPAAGVFDRQVRWEAERLRVDHDCEHHSWRIRHGGGQCESCYFTLDRYLLRCLGCQMLACVRCRRNRL